MEYLIKRGHLQEYIRKTGPLVAANEVTEAEQLCTGVDILAIYETKDIPGHNIRQRKWKVQQVNMVNEMTHRTYYFNIFSTVNRNENDISFKRS